MNSRQRAIAFAAMRRADRAVRRIEDPGTWDQIFAAEVETRVRWVLMQVRADVDAVDLAERHGRNFLLPSPIRHKWAALGWEASRRLSARSNLESGEFTGQMRERP